MIFQHSILHVNKKYFFALITLLYVLFAIIINEYILTEEHYYRTFSEQLSANQIDEILNLQVKWYRIGYVLIPFSIAIKLSLVATVLKIGVIFSNLKINFKQLFHLFKINLVASGK